jgi:hypothetical protein
MPVDRVGKFGRHFLPVTSVTKRALALKLPLPAILDPAFEKSSLFDSPSSFSKEKRTHSVLISNGVAVKAGYDSMFLRQSWEPFSAIH